MTHFLENITTETNITSLQDNRFFTNNSLIDFRLKYNFNPSSLNFHFWGAQTQWCFFQGRRIWAPNLFVGRFPCVPTSCCLKCCIVSPNPSPLWSLAQFSPTLSFSLYSKYCNLFQLSPSLCVCQPLLHSSHLLSLSGDPNYNFCTSSHVIPLQPKIPRKMIHSKNFLKFFPGAKQRSAANFPKALIVLGELTLI